MYFLETLFPIEYEIPSLKLVFEIFPVNCAEEECFLHLAHLDETRRDVKMNNDANEKSVKEKYNKNVKPHAFSKGDLELLYD